MDSVFSRQLRSLFQGIELLQNVREFWFALLDDLGVCALEEIVGWDPAQPLLFGELFVAGEIEAYQQFHGTIFAAGFIGRPGLGLRL